MPCLTIPPSGVLLEGLESSSSRPAAIVGLTLSDSLIEDMIKSISMGKGLQLSLGREPSISFGDMTQHLSSSHDPFACDIYHTTYSRNTNINDTMSKPVGSKVGSSSMWFFKSKKGPVARQEESDEAIATLNKAVATRAVKKSSNPTKSLVGLAMDNKKGGKKGFLNSTPSFTGANRSMPTSPSLTGVASPRLAPTSAPLSLSEQQAEKNKSIRNPIIHILAVEPATEAELRKSKKDEWTDEEFKMNIDKVADRDGDKYLLRQKMYKELDVFKYSYPDDEDRQKAIDNAVRAYDKMRINSSAPEWDRLLPKEERGTGKCLSKLQAKIATGTAKLPKINVQKPNDGTTSGMEDSGAEGSVKNDGGRSGSAPAQKRSKPSAKEAQAKRLLSKGGVTKAPPKSMRKTAPPKQDEKFLSSQYISDSDEEIDEVGVAPASGAEKQTVAKKATKAAPTSAPGGLRKSPVKTAAHKRINSDTGSDTPMQKKWMSAKKNSTTPKNPVNRNKLASPEPPPTSHPAPTHSSQVPKNPVKRNGANPDPSASSAPAAKNAAKRKSSTEDMVESPVLKKAKVDTPARKSPMPATNHRASPTTSSSISGSATEGRRPHKSSPLASSPPTNASDLEDDNNSYVSSASTDKSKTPVEQPIEVLRMARKFQVWYKEYEEKYRGLEKLNAREREERKGDVEKMLAMHDKLARMKRDIVSGCIR